MPSVVIDVSGSRSGSWEEKPFLILDCPVKHYEWGKTEGRGMVAKLTTLRISDPKKPFAELWMGTHPSGPSIVSAGPSQGHKLSQIIGKDLPFLFKVLSVQKPLSIQAHPDKSLAKLLHSHSSQHYPDANHKPEMAIALSDPFEALFGFRQDALQSVLQVPEIKKLVMEKDMKATFTNLITKVTEETVEAIHARLEKAQSLSKEDQLFMRLFFFFPKDIGCLAAFYMNHLKLSPGQAIYIPANEPHAYLSGDCIEVMACSDNVVRAGLTPKYKDVDTLCAMLTYKPLCTREALLKPEERNPGQWTYSVPGIEEFSVLYIDQSVTKVTLQPDSIAIVLDGNAIIPDHPDNHHCQMGGGDVLPAGTVMYVRNEMCLKCDQAVVYVASSNFSKL